MPNLPEGFRRLSLLFGGAGLVVWLSFAAVQSHGFAGLAPSDWVFLVLGAVLSFVAPWAVTRGVGWVATGFRGR